MFVYKNMQITSRDFSRKSLTSLPYKDIEKNVNWLILSDNRLRVIDNQIKNYKQITRLALNDNRIESISSDIEYCSNINWIDLTRNKLKELPLEFGNLTKITGLGLSENNFESIPEAVYKLVNLRKFGFFSNKITNISPNIKFLTSLVKIDLSNNKIKEIPEELLTLTNLSWLNLSNNAIKKLPPAINNLKNLEELGLGMNELEELPEMSNLTNLRIFQVFKKNLKKIHQSFFLLNKIEKLDFSDNMLAEFPHEALNSKTLKYLNLRNNSIEYISSKYITPNKLCTISMLDISDNNLSSVPYRLFTIFKNSTAIRLNNIPYTLLNKKIPVNFSLTELCFSNLLKRNIEMRNLDKLFKSFYRKISYCDVCSCKFVTDPYLIYSESFFEPENKFVIEKVACSHICCSKSTK